jgi:membrane protein DedA with SNARE-associated domain
MHWLTSVGSWAYVVAFVAAASEAALFVGLVFPGETVLLGAGYLAWRGVLSLPLLIAIAAAGAIIGDSIGYEIGRHFGDRVRHSSLGRRLGRDRWARARSYLRDNGGKAVFAGRFVAVAKTLTPALAGDARMAYPRFLGWNVAGACVWACVHVGIGYIAGPSYETIDRYLGIGGWALLVVVVLGGAGWWWRRHH